MCRWFWTKPKSCRGTEGDRGDICNVWLESTFLHKDSSVQLHRYHTILHRQRDGVQGGIRPQYSVLHNYQKNHPFIEMLLLVFSFSPAVAASQYFKFSFPTALIRLDLFLALLFASNPNFHRSGALGSSKTTSIQKKNQRPQWMFFASANLCWKLLQWGSCQRLWINHGQESQQSWWSWI